MGAAPWLPAPVLMAGWLEALLWHWPLAYCSRDGSAFTVLDDWSPVAWSACCPRPRSSCGCRRWRGRHTATPSWRSPRSWPCPRTWPQVCYPGATAKLVLVLPPEHEAVSGAGPGPHAVLQTPRAAVPRLPPTPPRSLHSGGEVRSSLLWPVTCTGTHAPSLHQWVPSPPQLVPSSGGPSKHENHASKC